MRMTVTTTERYLLRVPRLYQDALLSECTYWIAGLAVCHALPFLLPCCWLYPGQQAIQHVTVINISLEINLRAELQMRNAKRVAHKQKVVSTFNIFQ